MTKQKDPFTLFELTDEIKAIIADIVDADIAGDTEEVRALMQELDEFHDKRSDKLEAYVRVIKNSIATAKNRRAEAEEFAKRARALENLAKRLKRTLLYNLREHGEEVANAGDFKITRRENPQPTVKVSVEGWELPEEFQRLKPEPDKDALRVALQAGDKVDGVTLEDDEHIRIGVR